jgi:hypothetical protein
MQNKELKEFLNLGADAIRINNTHLARFVEEYYKVFGTRPDCAGCTFKTTYSSLLKQIGIKKNTNFIKTVIMTEFKVNVRQRNVIHSFTDPKTKKVRRSYGKNMTDDFAKGFIKHGTKNQIKERKLIFDLIPEKKQAVKKASVGTQSVKKIEKDAEPINDSKD